MPSIREFAETLPPDYRERFDNEQMAIHAAAAERRSRSGHAVAATLFPWSEPGTLALCVVAEDRPGLLSKLSRALTELGCDVDSALAFTRTQVNGSAAEAVDFFFLRSGASARSNFDESRVRDFVELTEQILNQDRDSAPPVVSAPSGVSDTTVRFLEDESGALSVLEVETSDRSGLLWALTRALYQENVQIIGSKISTVGGRVHDRFVLRELDSSPIGAERRLVIQVAVLTALAH